MPPSKSPALAQGGSARGPPTPPELSSREGASAAWRAKEQQDTTAGQAEEAAQPQDRAQQQHEGEGQQGASGDCHGSLGAWAELLQRVRKGTPDATPEPCDILQAKGVGEAHELGSARAVWTPRLDPEDELVLFSPPFSWSKCSKNQHSMVASPPVAPPQPEGGQGLEGARPRALGAPDTVSRLGDRVAAASSCKPKLPEASEDDCSTEPPSSNEASRQQERFEKQQSSTEDEIGIQQPGSTEAKKLNAVMDAMHFQEFSRPQGLAAHRGRPGRSSRRGSNMAPLAAAAAASGAATASACAAPAAASPAAGATRGVEAEANEGLIIKNLLAAMAWNGSSEEEFDGSNFTATLSGGSSLPSWSSLKSKSKRVRRGRSSLLSNGLMECPSSQRTAPNPIAAALEEVPSSSSDSWTSELGRFASSWASQLGLPGFSPASVHEPEQGTASRKSSEASSRRASCASSLRGHGIALAVVPAGRRLEPGDLLQLTEASVRPEGLKLSDTQPAEIVAVDRLERIYKVKTEGGLLRKLRAESDTLLIEESGSRAIGRRGPAEKQRAARPSRN